MSENNSKGTSNGQEQTNGPITNGNSLYNAPGAHIPAQPPLSDFLLQLEDYTPTIPGISHIFFSEKLKIVY